MLDIEIQLIHGVQEFEGPDGYLEACYTVRAPLGANVWTVCEDGGYLGAFTVPTDPTVEPTVIDGAIPPDIFKITTEAVLERYVLKSYGDDLRESLQRLNVAHHTTKDIKRVITE